MLFDQNWFLKYQSELLEFANTFIGRIFFRIYNNRSGVGNRRITEIGPNYIEWIDEQGNNVVEFRTHDKFAKRLYYGLKPVWYAIHYWDIFIANNFLPALNLGFDTLAVYPTSGANSPVDGHTARQGIDESFSDITTRAGNDHDASSTIAVARLVTGPAGYSGLFRAGFCFNTSKLGMQSKISAVTLSLYGDSKYNTCGDPTLDICDFNPASFSALANSDYGNFGSTAWSQKAYGSFSVAAYNAFSLSNAGILNLNRTGVSAYGARLDWDLTASSSGFTRTNNGDFSGFYIKAADTAGTSQDPTLTVTYKRQLIMATALTTTSTSTSTSTTTTSTTSSTTSTSTTTTSTSTTTTSTSTTTTSTSTTTTSTTTTSSSTTTTSTTTTIDYSIRVDSGL